MQCQILSKYNSPLSIKQVTLLSGQLVLFALPSKSLEIYTEHMSTHTDVGNHA